MKICLVHLPAKSEFEKHWAKYPVLGLAYLAASARAAGHEVSLIDGKLQDLNMEQVFDLVCENAPDIIGITSMTVEFSLAIQLAEKLKQKYQTPIIIGGAHVNAVGEEALVQCPYFDFACVGEGESLLPELAEAMLGRREYGDIAGLIYRKGEEIISHIPRAYPDDYDSLPFPAWDMFRIGDEVPVLTHRGCPFKCTFCGHNSGFKARFRSVENVIEEIALAVESYRPKVIRFEDETFGLDLRRTKSILLGLIDRGLPSKVAFSAQTRVDKVDEEFIQLLKRANFKTLELGVESGNPEILKSIRKGITIEQVVTATHLAKKAGLKVWCKFILGHPNETNRTVIDTIRFLTKLNPDQLSVSIMTPFPGTPIYDMALRGEGGYVLLSSEWDNFDKYSAGALELVGLPLYKLKLYQIACYLSLYILNRRFGELIELIMKNKNMAFEMLLGVPNALLFRLMPARQRRL